MRRTVPGLCLERSPTRSVMGRCPMATTSPMSSRAMTATWESSSLAYEARQHNSLASRRYRMSPGKASPERRRHRFSPMPLHTSAPHSSNAGREADAAGTDLRWREFFAGAAASVVAAHALIAAAADERTTCLDAMRIDATYLSISSLVTSLDSLIDYELDVSTGKPAHVQHYEDQDVLAEALSEVTRHAVSQARQMPNSGHHVMILFAAVAYYTSAPGASSEFARPVTTRIRSELRPLITPPLLFMRAWRLAKRARQSRGRGEQESFVDMVSLPHAESGASRSSVV